MANKENQLRVCPTRTDGSPVLFTHRLDTGRCQERQRQRYHKCFTCAYNNNFVSKNGLPLAEALATASETPAEPVKHSTAASEPTPATL
ncbi:MAG: hypothetical protein ABGY71_09590 [bacterium]|jgi:hypothetical protein|nr:hypothetical protein [Planctomycetota bacterium]HIL52475.1 hypothetical protein [Planctomycetota bacterium]